MSDIRSQLLKIIKLRGYWVINFKPFVDQKLQLAKCKEVVEKSSVELRGWDYPHIPRRTGEDTGLVPGNDYYEGWIDWGAHKELWRMYQSGQFIHYRATEEDWFKDDDWYGDLKKIEPGKVLSILSKVYFITEIYEFLSRLARSGLYKERVEVIIQLSNTANRKLEVLDPGRGPLFVEYRTGAQTIDFKKNYTYEEIRDSSKEHALESILSIFQRFGWNNPPIEIIKSDQEKLLTRKI